MTFDQACAIVAKKYLNGTKLVTGHRALYFKEAAELYAKSKWDDACLATKLSCITSVKFIVGRRETEIDLIDLHEKTINQIDKSAKPEFE